MKPFLSVLTALLLFAQANPPNKYDEAFKEADKTFNELMPIVKYWGLVIKYTEKTKC